MLSPFASEGHWLFFLSLLYRGAVLQVLLFPSSTCHFFSAVFCFLSTLAYGKPPSLSSQGQLLPPVRRDLIMSGPLHFRQHQNPLLHKWDGAVLFLRTCVACFSSLQDHLKVELPCTAYGDSSCPCRSWVAAVVHCSCIACAGSNCAMFLQCSTEALSIRQSRYSLKGSWNSKRC